ncbi:ribosome biogenesis GTP-binding protein YsxC [Neokomagataea thailandica NBRC 106555]|uniref:Probable GTP-binding protein EngB n=2 Tax=Neokomagataea TaxID=1223423 RepID=A0A4Y6V448_9PROT|nr:MULTISPECIES: ribosome biogenesis GTP-binding protein YihA/YsxC [Neokomagataea]QDH24839.1 YihA family ribosome biogenesis GTP-binding protein [Neokomagataea tanensis]GBR50109.1 ribosome biogenesis GTP-binding protein YsxC [Neokomagataea thailandica NBRC 106555]
MREIAGPPSPELLEEGRLLFAGECDFYFGSQRVDQLPPIDLPEVAFAGRSNVGKSSLINALTGRKSLARASSEPGRTKQLNFFNLSQRLALVDMPGYGFAKAAKSVKEDWQNTMFAYLRGRTTLERVILLLDARIELKTSDKDVMELLDRAAVVFQIVLTKADQVKPGALQKKREEIEALALKHAAAYPRVIVTSSETGEGIEDLRGEIARFARSSDGTAQS